MTILANFLLIPPRHRLSLPRSRPIRHNRKSSPWPLRVSSMILRVILFGSLLAAFASGSLAACPFCGTEQRGPTFVEDFAQAQIVLLGTFSNAKAGGTLEESSSRFQLEQVIKSHEAIKGKPESTLPKH